ALIRFRVARKPIYGDSVKATLEVVTRKERVEIILDIARLWLNNEHFLTLPVPAFLPQRHDAISLSQIGGRKYVRRIPGRGVVHSIAINLGSSRGARLHRLQTRPHGKIGRA